MKMESVFGRNRRRKKKFGNMENMDFLYNTNALADMRKSMTRTTGWQIKLVTT